MINERQKRTPYYVYIYLGGGWIRMKDEKSVSASGVPFFFSFFLMHADYTIKEILCMIHVLFINSVCTVYVQYTYGLHTVYGIYNHFIQKKY